MYRTIILLRLGCLLFGGAMGALLPGHILRRFPPGMKSGGTKMLQLMFDVTKTVVSCAAAVWLVPLPVYTVILYTGAGVTATCAGALPEEKWQPLPILCTWLILYLPVTGALACLGGMLLVVAMDAPGMSGLAVLVVAAPMALLQFGTEGCLVLISAAAFLASRQIFWVWVSRQKTHSHPG